MFKKILATGAVVGSALMFAAAGAGPAMAEGPNLIDNGGFDAPGYNDNGGVFETGSNFGGWELSDPMRNDKIIKVWYPGATDSDLPAPYTYGPWIRTTGTLSQTIPTEAGKTYTLTYDHRASGTGTGPAAAGGWAGGNSGTVKVNGASVDSFSTVADPLYSTRTVSFTATGSSTAVSFSSDGSAVGLDNVSVNEVPENDSPVMVPAIAGGLGIAALAGGALTFSRRNKRGSE